MSKEILCFNCTNCKRFKEILKKRDAMLSQNIKKTHKIALETARLELRWSPFSSFYGERIANFEQGLLLLDNENITETEQKCVNEYYDKSLLYLT